MAARKKKPEQKPKLGRPTKYTPELARKICREVSTTTDGLGKICSENPDFPTEKNIHIWRLDNETFRQQYDTAKRIQADLLAEEIINIADDSSRDIINRTDRDGNDYEVINTEFVARSRLKMDARKWIVSKLLPKVYGDKTTTESTVTIKHEDVLKTLDE